MVAIADGDTLTILDSENVQHKIRLAGIDAPERSQDFANRSKENLSRLAFHKNVWVVGGKTDRYGRIVGVVRVDEADICLEQIKAGLAWHFKRFEHEQPPRERQTYAAAEREARLARRGIWSIPGPTPPWEFRAASRPSQ